MEAIATKDATKTWTPDYSPWRHGGWYVHNVRYPSGACGCVSNNYDDGKWRIAQSGFFHITFPSRDAAAKAEYIYCAALNEAAARKTELLEALQGCLTHLDLIAREHGHERSHFIAADNARDILARAEGHTP
jgi:hypothetical protein